MQQQTLAEAVTTEPEITTMEWPITRPANNPNRMVDEPERHPSSLRKSIGEVRFNCFKFFLYQTTPSPIDINQALQKPNKTVLILMEKSEKIIGKCEGFV
jgi:hypothetical protein